jgi:L-rhamnose-H+ transport protein
MQAAFGISFVLLGSAVNAAFAVPMRFMPKWKFEHTWLIYSLLALVVFPTGLALASVPHISEVITGNESSAAVLVLIGLCWGIGQVCFGKALAELGISLATAIMLGISIVLGSTAPWFWTRSFHPDAAMGVLAASLFLSVGGVVLCSLAGRSRSNSEITAHGLYCAIAAGIGASLFNVAVVAGAPITSAALHQGTRPALAQTAAWLPFLLGGAVPNLAYCIYNVVTHHNAALFFSPGTRTYWPSVTMMSVCWLGSSLLYGFGAEQMGRLGPGIAYPVYISSIVVCTTLIGAVLGEWRDAPRRSLLALQFGLGFLIASIVLASRVHRHLPT